MPGANWTLPARILDWASQATPLQPHPPQARPTPRSLLGRGATPPLSASSDATPHLPSLQICFPWTLPSRTLRVNRLPPIPESPDSVPHPERCPSLPVRQLHHLALPPLLSRWSWTLPSRSPIHPAWPSLLPTLPAAFPGGKTFGLLPHPLANHQATTLRETPHPVTQQGQIPARLPPDHPQPPPLPTLHQRPGPPRPPPVFWANSE
jgi:hypothetical protein